jgi:hypothetical protein
MKTLKFHRFLFHEKYTVRKDACKYSKGASKYAFQLYESLIKEPDAIKSLENLLRERKRYQTIVDSLYKKK